MSINTLLDKLFDKVYGSKSHASRKLFKFGIICVVVGFVGLIGIALILLALVFFSVFFALLFS